MGHCEHSTTRAAGLYVDETSEPSLRAKGRRPERSNLCVCLLNSAGEIASVALLPRNDETVVCFLGAERSNFYMRLHVTEEIASSCFALGAA
ncbi:MAG: hypothetical protein C4532_13140 [Candidatus Abyssobacteria bacterium SURF_17]|uniref:Uncharacterized protein n=1 Tax=Candidatus Abyssobacteria bacterium SURF_17 TaxID=2093361 RepID=A0A419EV91_9BACT|nr:MAG: hypothetical protein C4532_13140 [Candidatus Abyssubacteria bacterium SURF_17]